MRAIVIAEPGGPEVLQVQEVADPVPGDGEVLIAVKAFGVNHAETHMRKGEWSSTIPFGEIVAKAEAGVYQAEPARVFAFDEIAEAHRVMEAGEAVGKLVVAGA
jgi:NADPH:quinone reductase